VRGAIPPPLTPARSILAANDWLHRELFLALPRPSPALDKLLNEAEIPVAALVERVTSSIGLSQHSLMLLSFIITDLYVQVWYNSLPRTLRGSLSRPSSSSMS